MKNQNQDEESEGNDSEDEDEGMEDEEDGGSDEGDSDIGESDDEDSEDLSSDDEEDVELEDEGPDEPGVTSEMKRQRKAALKREAKIANRAMRIKMGKSGAQAASRRSIKKGKDACQRKLWNNAVR